MMLRHAKLQLQYRGEYTGIREMRKHVAWYTAGFPHSAKLRKRVNEVESMEALEELLQSWSEINALQFVLKTVQPGSLNGRQYFS